MTKVEPILTGLSSNVIWTSLSYFEYRINIREPQNKYAGQSLGAADRSENLGSVR